MLFYNRLFYDEERGGEKRGSEGRKGEIEKEGEGMNADTQCSTCGTRQIRFICTLTKETSNNLEYRETHQADWFTFR